jgi:hypothetical protein
MSITRPLKSLLSKLHDVEKKKAASSKSTQVPPLTKVPTPARPLLAQSLSNESTVESDPYENISLSPRSTTPAQLAAHAEADMLATMNPDSGRMPTDSGYASRCPSDCLLSGSSAARPSTARPSPVALAQSPIYEGKDMENWIKGLARLSERGFEWVPMTDSEMKHIYNINVKKSEYAKLSQEDREKYFETKFRRRRVLPGRPEVERVQWRTVNWAPEDEERGRDEDLDPLDPEVLGSDTVGVSESSEESVDNGRWLEQRPVQKWKGPGAQPAYEP